MDGIVRAKCRRDCVDRDILYTFVDRYSFFLFVITRGYKIKECNLGWVYIARNQPAPYILIPSQEIRQVVEIVDIDLNVKSPPK